METIRNKLKDASVQGLLLILAFVTAFAAILIVSAQPVVLTLGVFAGSAWDVPSPESQKLIDQAVQYFEEQNPGIRVKYQSGIQASDYSLWLTDQAALGNLPDVFMILPDDFSLLASTNALLNLNTCLQEDQALSKDDFYPIAFQTGQYEKNCYALPFESNPELMFANTTILDEHQIPLKKDGWSLDEFYEICRKVSSDDSGSHAPIANYSWLDAVNAWQCHVFNEGKKSVNLTQDPFRQAFSYARSINSMLDDFALEEQSFDDGKTAFSTMTVAQYRTYKPYPWRIKRLSAFDWEAVPMPGSAQGGYISCQSLLMGISAHTLYKEASWKLLKCFCADKKIQESIYDYSQGVSVLKNAEIMEDADSGLDNALLSKVMHSQNENADLQLQNTAMEQLSSRLEAMMHSEEDTDLALMNVQDQVNLYLSGQIQ